MEKKIIHRDKQTYCIPICKKTKEEFEKQARSIWGDRYDYTNSVYQDGKKPIEIYCQKHDFKFRIPMAQNHIIKSKKQAPTGCPICRAEEKHGIEYGKDWRKYLVLSKKQSRVAKIDAILEKEHREQRKKQREKERLKRKSKNIEKEKARQDYILKYNAKSLIEARFIERVHEMYGQIYDTKNVDYKGCDIPVTLICEKHGPFAISPRTLLRGGHGRKPHGCPQCEGVKCYKPTIDPESLFERLETLYGGDLVFEKVVVKRRDESVIAQCKKHGRIKHSVNYWLTGKGCEYCNGKWFQPDWEKYARNVHGDKYEYLTAPKTMDDKIQIKCPVHGVFTQSYLAHIKLGNGCPECAQKHLPLGKRKANFLKRAKEKHGNRFTYHMQIARLHIPDNAGHTHSQERRLPYLRYVVGRISDSLLA